MIKRPSSFCKVSALLEAYSKISVLGWDTIHLWQIFWTFVKDNSLQSISRTYKAVVHVFVEMVEAMTKVASLDIDLTVEERNLLSVAFKNVIGARRASWRIMSSLEQKEESKENSEKKDQMKQYRQKVKIMYSVISFICIYWLI